MSMSLFRDLFPLAIDFEKLIRDIREIDDPTSCAPREETTVRVTIAGDEHRSLNFLEHFTPHAYLPHPFGAISRTLRPVTTQ
jgi:hypothetical protein